MNRGGIGVALVIGVFLVTVSTCCAVALVGLAWLFETLAEFN
jgi:hypothetical protein